MNKKGLIARTVVGAFGGVLLLGAAGAAFAAEVDDSDVGVDVSIAPLPSVGALTMTVASGSTTLSEVTSADPEIRQFNGQLPTVMVSDDREEVPTGVYWYVVGQSSAFTATGATPLEAGYFGWAPKLITAEGNGEVAEGQQVDTILDSGAAAVGLVGEELLALALDSGEAASVGTWQVGADLFLKTPVDVAPGEYTGTITLTLWEDDAT